MLNYEENTFLKKEKKPWIEWAWSISCCWKMWPTTTTQFGSTCLAIVREQMTLSSKSLHYDVTRSKPLESPVVDVARTKRKAWCLLKTFTMGIWNICIMNQGKLDIVKMKITWTMIEILGISVIENPKLLATHFIFDCKYLSSAHKEHCLKNKWSISQSLLYLERHCWPEFSSGHWSLHQCCARSFRDNWSIIQ